MHARDSEQTAQRPSWRVLLLGVLMAIALAGLAGCSDSPAPAATISVQPSDASAVVGSAATLSVTASGPDIAYQWQLSTDSGTTWSDVPGATQASYTTPPTTLADSGKRYRVVVSAAGTSVNSSAVQLTVTGAVIAPSLTVQPASQTAAAPDAATFSVTASGTSPGYQWQRSTDGTTFVDITGATAASYSTGATAITMDGERYRVVVSNSAGSVTSSAALLTVNPAPVAATFTTQPANQSVIAGSAATFTVAATGTPAPTLQWQRSTDGGATFANIAGAIDPIFNTGLTTLSQNGERYRALATNTGGSATSNAATLSVDPAPQAPAFTTQPTAQTVTAPAAATFSAAASGVPTPTLQWQLSTDGGTTFANINGATGGSYTTPATTTADSGKRYRVIATNSAGSRTSTTVGLGVLASAPVTPFLGRWPTPSMVEAVNNSVGGLIREVQLACGRDGSCLGVWARISSNDPANDGVYAARYTTAAGWGAVSPVALDRGREPRVGVDDLGNAVVAWSANDATNTRQAFVRRFSPTTGWSSVAQLSPAGTDRTTTPMALAMNGSGQVTVAYARRLAADAADSLWAARPDGGGWTSVRVPDAGTTINDLSARVDGLGRPTLLWRGTGDAVLAASGAADGAWPNAVNLSGTRNSGAAPRLALDADGQAIAVWLDDVAGGDTTLNLRRRPGGGAWQAAQIQTFAAAEGVNRVDLAAGPAGVAMVVYAIGAGNIATRDFTAAGGWSPTHTLLVDGAVIDSGLPRIVMDGSGNVTVLWRGIDNAGNGALYTRSYAAGLGWAPLLTASPIPLATYEQSYRETALAPLGDGRAAMLFLRTNTSFLDELLGAVQTP